MLKKLLKYDLKYMMKNMTVFYALSIFFAIATRILSCMNQTVFINVIGKISLGCMFSMTCSILFNTILRSWIRFKDSIYKDEAYLTHTLPVTKKQIYYSKLLESIIFEIVGFIIILISLFTTYYSPEKWILLRNTFNSLSKGLNLNTWYIVISIVLIFFLEIINVIQSGFLGIILGNKKNNIKVVYSLLYGFISYILSQAFVVVSLLIIGLFSSDIMSIFTSNTLINNSIIQLIVSISIIIYAILIIIMSFICSKKLSKGVDVE